MRRVVPRRLDHRIQFDRIHTFEHRPSQASPALLRRNAAWIAVGRWLGLQIEHGFSIDGCNVCEVRISPRFFMKQIASLTVTWAKNSGSGRAAETESAPRPPH